MAVCDSIKLPKTAWRASDSLFVFAFVMAGMIQVILPKELILKWIGKESGIKGILIDTIAGSLAPGGHLKEELNLKDKQKIEKNIDKLFLTSVGKQLAKEKYNSGNHKTIK